MQYHSGTTPHVMGEGGGQVPLQGKGITVNHVAAGVGFGERKSP